MAPSKPKPRRALQTAAALTTSPPDTLPPQHTIAQVGKAIGNNLYTCNLPDDTKTEILAELAPQFRSKIWLKRGGYVVIDFAAFEGRGNKIAGEIVNVVREEKVWRRMAYWPAQFPKMNSWDISAESDGEEGSDDERPPLRGYSEDEEEEEEVEEGKSRKEEEEYTQSKSSPETKHVPISAPPTGGGGGCLEAKQ